MNNNYTLLGKQSEMDKKEMQTTIHNPNELIKIMKLETDKLELNHKPGELSSIEEINDVGDPADDTKWVRVQNRRKKRKLAFVKSPKNLQKIKTKESVLLHIR
jgi:hypothetical protein